MVSYGVRLVSVCNSKNSTSLQSRNVWRVYCDTNGKLDNYEIVRLTLDRCRERMKLPSIGVWKVSGLLEEQAVYWPLISQAVLPSAFWAGRGLEKIGPAELHLLAKKHSLKRWFFYDRRWNRRELYIMSSVLAASWFKNIALSSREFRRSLMLIYC